MWIVKGLWIDIHVRQNVIKLAYIAEQNTVVWRWLTGGNGCIQKSHDEMFDPFTHEQYDGEWLPFLPAYQGWFAYKITKYMEWVDHFVIWCTQRHFTCIFQDCIILLTVTLWWQKGIVLDFKIYFKCDISDNKIWRLCIPLTRLVKVLKLRRNWDLNATCIFCFHFKLYSKYNTKYN